jgi:polysaccharide chain length determinant protein (PEP-CTERM system associated)
LRIEVEIGVIPGKQYKPEDIVEAAWRWRWLIVVPFLAITFGTILVAALLPDRYSSEAVLLIVPQRVPENYVRPTVTGRLDDRLRAMSQQIMSRSRLELIIQEFDLYARERKTMTMEDIVEMMRTRDVDIQLHGGGGVDAGQFTISYSSSNPRTAMRVAERLASLFIRENIEDRAVFADMTGQFLETQLDDARRQLMEHEKKLEEFRKANAGRLPSESDSNSQAMLNTQMQLSTLQESINRDRDRQTMLQRLIADTNNLAAMSALSAASANSDSGPAGTPSPSRQLEAARANLKLLETRLKPDHPDIKMAKRVIRDLEQKVAADALQQPVSPVSAATASIETARAGKLADYQTEYDLIDRRIKSEQEEAKRLTAAMVAYRQRIEAAPGLESQLTALMRDYTTLQTTYQTLLAKSQEAKVAANLERRQIGEQFKIIDSPRLPQRPISPNRPLIDLLGACVGLCIGLGLAGVFEYRDSSLRTESDVAIALALPVLGLVPTITTAAERGRQKRRQLLVAASGVLFTLLCVAAIAWKFQVLTNWMR